MKVMKITAAPVSSSKQKTGRTLKIHSCSYQVYTASRHFFSTFSLVSNVVRFMFT